MNELVVILITVLLFSGITIIGLVYYFSRKFAEMEKSRAGDSGMQFLNQNIRDMQNNISQALDTTTQAVNARLDNAARVIMSVNSELGQMREIGSDLKNIQDFLKSPKLRGNLGEQGLKELLYSALPKQYISLQHTFRNGTTVDALIKLEAGTIPIDAKFPFENFNAMYRAETEELRKNCRKKFREDFKKHIGAISSKYINPDENTVDFAFMYIPSETIYFEVINNEQDLFDYAASLHVVLSSPSTFFYYLRTIMLGLEGKRITEMSREILKVLQTIKQQSQLLGDNISVLRHHIGNAGKSMSQVSDQYGKLATKIDRVSALENSTAELLESNHDE